MLMADSCLSRAHAQLQLERMSWRNEEDFWPVCLANSETGAA